MEHAPALTTTILGGGLLPGVRSRDQEVIGISLLLFSKIFYYTLDLSWELSQLLSREITQKLPGCSVSTNRVNRHVYGLFGKLICMFSAISVPARTISS